MLAQRHRVAGSDDARSLGALVNSCAGGLRRRGRPRQLCIPLMWLQNSGPGIRSNGIIASLEGDTPDDKCTLRSLSSDCQREFLENEFFSGDARKTYALVIPTIMTE